MKIKYTDLRFGEVFLTTKEHTYSLFDQNYEHITIPENTALLFRSFKEYQSKNPTNTKQELALFYWLKERKTICVVVSEETPILYMNHVEWESRNENSEYNIFEEKRDN